MVKGTVKKILGKLLYTSGYYKKYFKNRAVIVLFHRINDLIKDNSLTVSKNQFSNFCDFFEKYFEVIRLGDLLNLLREGKDISRKLVITFDDGYKDNYEYAAFELKKRDLPACFFISTGFIQTEKSAWWDEESNIVSEWMTWNDIKALHKMEFEIGAHTINHVDLGKAKKADATKEIDGSKKMLEKIIEEKPLFFSFPYGNKENICSENIQIIKNARFDCCLAVDGGMVNLNDNLFNLKRVPVCERHHSVFEFGFELVAWYK